MLLALGNGVLHLQDAAKDIGIVELIQERKISASVVLDAKDIYDNWKYVDLYSRSPYDVENALKLELRERGWGLLARWHLPDHGRLTLADYLLLIGLQHTLNDTLHVEQYSPFYPPEIIRWVSTCSSFLDIIDEESDEFSLSSKDCSVFTGAIVILPSTMVQTNRDPQKLAGTLTATFLRAQSDSEDDPRFRLVINMMGKYPETREWSSLEKVLKRLPVKEYCLKFWRMV